MMNIVAVCSFLFSLFTQQRKKNEPEKRYANDTCVSFVASKPEWSERSEAMKEKKMRFTVVTLQLPGRKFMKYLYSY